VWTSTLQGDLDANYFPTIIPSLIGAVMKMILTRPMLVQSISNLGLYSKKIEKLIRFKRMVQLFLVSIANQTGVH